MDRPEIKSDNTGYENFLYEKWSPRLAYTDIDQVSGKSEKDIINCHLNLMELINTHGYNEAEVLQIKLAELVLWEAMEGHKLRNDDRPYDTHCYDAAEIVSSWGGGAEDISLALLHDTVEESKTITLNDIGNLFGNTMRMSVDGLSQARSRKNLDLEIRTHHKIYELIRINPKAVAVKIADRVHFMRTRETMKPETRLAKARETLDYYVPLATALGLHSASQELSASAMFDINTFVFDSRLEMPHTEIEYIKVLNIYTGFIATLPEIYCLHDVSSPRIPNLWDCYKLNGKSLEKIPQAYAPVFVPIVVPDDQVEQSKVDPWSDRVLGIGHQLFIEGQLTRTSYDELFAIVSQKQKLSSARISFQKDGVPVRIIFLRPHEDMEWRASVFDTHDPHPVIQNAAINKLINLRSAYRQISNPDNMTQELEDANDMLLRGAIIFKDIKGNEWGLSRRATLVDALFQIHKLPNWRKVNGAIITDSSKISRETVDLSTEVIGGMKIIFTNSETSSVTPKWLDMATTPKARRTIRMYLTHLMKEERMKSKEFTIEEGTMAYQIRKRGVEIIHQLYARVAKEAGLPLTKLLLSIIEAEDVYKQKVQKYAYDGGNQKHRNYNDFMIRVGLSEDGFRPDDGRTSVIWDVVYELIELQKASHMIEINLPDRVGVMAELTAKLAEIGVNIESMLLDHDDNNPGCGKITITVSKKIWEKICQYGEDRFREYVVS